MKLEQPILIELDDLEFMIVDEIELSNLKHLQIDLKGIRYNYENVVLSKQHRTLAVYDLKKNIVFSVTEDGEIIE